MFLSKFLQNMNKTSNKITENEITQLQEKCLQQVAQEHLYSIRNDAKLRAVYSSECYEEFK